MDVTTVAAILCFSILAAELAFPYSAPRVERLRGWVSRIGRMAKNLGLAAVNVAAAPVIVVAVTGLAGRWSLHWRPEWLAGYGLGALVLDLLVLDLWIYAWHRVVHAWSFTWRFHQVHHMDEAVDVTSALRFHAGDVFLSSISRGCVVLLMGIPLYHVFLFEVATVVFGVFHHSNWRLPRSFERALSFLIVTPSLHWVHHHQERAVHDSNYGTILSGWDRFFGTCSPTQRTPDLPLGVAGHADVGMLRLLARPFTRRSRAERSAAEA